MGHFDFSALTAYLQWEITGSEDLMSSLRTST